MPRLLLVRHGETVQNTQKRFQGHSSLPLSDRGKRQAVVLAEWLRHEEIDVAYHSGLPRASETAAILRSAVDLDWSEAAELRELNFGEWDGLTREEIRLRDPETLGHWELDPDRNPPSGGESLADLDLRVRAFLRRLTEARPGGTALVVSHGGPIRLIVCAALGLPRDWHWRFAVSPGSLSEVVVDPGGAVLTRLNVAPPTAGESWKTDMGRLILVTGGVRSGKSDFAQSLAARAGGDRVLFVATAEGLDEEMRRRIAAHRDSRPTAWRTVEATGEVGRAVRDNVGDAAAVVVDCLTLLVSNTLLALGDEPDPAEAEARLSGEVAALVEAARAVTAAVIVVSGEVGLGLVPANPIGRLYRDLLGRANQAVAASADSVYFMVAGLPLDVKALAARAPATPD